MAVESGFEAELKGVSSGIEVSILGRLARWISFLSIYLFYYLAGPGLSWLMWDLSLRLWAQWLKGIGTWDLSSVTRTRTWVPALTGALFNHWTTREVPARWILKSLKILAGEEAALVPAEGTCLLFDLREPADGLLLIFVRLRSPCSSGLSLPLLGVACLLCGH